MLAICSVPCQSQTIDRALFERMVAITKHFEGWHDPKTITGLCGTMVTSYRRESVFPKTLTRQRADLLLRTDLLRHLRLYARYGRDAYLLATLSYQIGPAKLLGNGRYPKASLLTRLERGDRDILPLYLSYCKWREKQWHPLGTEVGGISAVVCRAVRHHPSYTCLSVTYIIYKGNNCNFNVKVRALWHPSN